MSDEGKAVVMRWYDQMWNGWDFACADEICRDDLSFRGSLGTVVRGIPELKAYMESVRSAFPDFHNEVVDMVAEGEKVVARLVYSGTHLGELHGFRPTGRRIAYDGAAIFTIANGRVAECWVLGDLQNLHRQLGGE